MASLASNGADMLLSLVEPHEFPDPGGLGSALAAAGIAWLRMPVADFDVPDRAAWPSVARELHDRLDRGGTIAIHCWSGLGRTGTVAARLLVERGLDPAAAIATIRACRPGAIETSEQAAWVARPI